VRRPGQGCSRPRWPERALLVVRDRRRAARLHQRLPAPGHASVHYPVRRCRCHQSAARTTAGPTVDGKLLAAPNLREMPDLQKEQFGLHEVAVTTWAGYLWAVSTPAPAPSSQDRATDPPAPRVDRRARWLRAGGISLWPGRSSTTWRRIGRRSSRTSPSATTARGIHPELTAAVPEFASGYGSISAGQWHGPLSASRRRASPRRTGGAGDLARAERGSERLFYGVILWPNVFLILVPDHVAAFRLDPLSCDRTRVTCDWLFEAGAVTDPSFDPTDAVEISTSRTGRISLPASAASSDTSRSFVNGACSSLPSI